MKIVDMTNLNPAHIVRLTDEFAIHASLQHQNILKVITQFGELIEQSNAYHYFIIMELAEMDLSKQIQLWHQAPNWQNKNYQTISNCCYQIACGINYIHEQNIGHYDIQPRNILIVNNETSKTPHKLYKISEFRIATRGKFIDSRVIKTSNYSAPECHTLQQCQNSFDMWSLGCIIFEITTGVQLYQDNVDIIQKIDQYVENLELKEQLKNMFTINPNQRATAIDVVTFFQSDQEWHSTKELSLYKKINIIGNGGYGCVHSVSNKAGQKFAMKVVPLFRFTANDIVQLTNEFALTKGMDHTNIVRIHSQFAVGHDESEQQYYLIMELGDRNLKTQIRIWHSDKQWQDCNIAQIINCFLQTSEAVNYIHCRKIIHRDIKPENYIVFEQNNKLIFKLTDFGAAKQIKNAEATTQIGTLLYMPPELLQVVQSYSLASDIWSLGCLFFEIATGVQAFQSVKDITVQNYDVQLVHDLQFRGIISQMILMDQSQRLTAHDICKSIRAMQGQASHLNLQSLLRSNRSTQKKTEEQ